MTLASVVVVTVAAAWLVFTSAYAPLSSGSYSGPRSRSVKLLTDGVEPTRYIIDGPVGQRARFNFDLRNDGSVAVRVHGLTREGWYGIKEVGWVPKGGNGEVMGGYAKDVRPFPVTIGPNDYVVLWVTVTKPRCQEGMQAPVEHIPLRWSVLGRDRVYNLDLQEVGEGWEIALCHPPEALEHVWSID
ncbi:MAG: hypothetical protein ACRDP8_12240 [Actinopolymorphaceae bacterium]